MKRLVGRHSRHLGFFKRRSTTYRRLNIPRTAASSFRPATASFDHAFHHFSLALSPLFFSTSIPEDKQTYPDHFHERVELDSSLPLSFSVNALLRIPLGQVHHLDFYTKFPNIIRACCKAGKLQEAQLLLERMLQEKRESGRVVPAKVFETVMFGWVKLAKKKPKKAIAKMLDIISLMEQEHEYDHQHALMQDDNGGVGDSCRPRTDTYNTLLRGMAEAATFLPKAARDAEQCLKTMEKLHRERGWHTKPNNRSYTYVMTAYGNVCRHDSGDLAQGVLERMKQMHQLEVKDFDATHDISYEDQSSREGYTKQIVKPDSAAYTAVIRAHAKSSSRDAANKAYAVLTEMHQNVRPDAIAITTCINAFANVASRSFGKKVDRIPADQREEAAQSAEALLLLMGDLAKEEENDSTLEGQSVGEEVEVVDEFDDEEWDNDDFIDDKRTGVSLQPTVITYNSVLNAFSKSDTRESAPRANALLQRMIEASLNDPNAVKPNRTSFNTVINAWARFSRYEPEAPVKAEDLMNLMYDMYYSGRMETVKPDAITYTTVINAWARSGDRPDKVQNARRLLDAMLSKYDADEDDLKPNIMAYTSVLNSAVHCPSSSITLEAGDGGDAFTSEATTENVYSILLQTYNELLNDPHNIGLSPDHFAFATMLQAIRQHTAETSAERRQMVESVFDDACAAGEVSSFVIRAVREACPSIDLLERLLRSPKLARELRDVSQLPQEWSRNLDYSPRLRKVDRGERQRKGQRKRRQPRNKTESETTQTFNT